jgi:DNA primase
VRPIRRAPVSAPLRWDEIAGLGRPDAFTIANLPERLAKVGDLLAPALKLPQKLPAKVFAAGEPKKEPTAPVKKSVRKPTAKAPPTIKRTKR